MGLQENKTVQNHFSKKSHSAENEPIRYIFTLSRTIPVLKTLPLSIQWLFYYFAAYFNTLSRTIPYIITFPTSIHWAEPYLAETIPYLCRVIQYNTLLNCTLSSYTCGYTFSGYRLHSLTQYMEAPPLPPSDRLNLLLLILTNAQRCKCILKHQYTEVSFRWELKP